MDTSRRTEDGDQFSENREMSHWRFGESVIEFRPDAPRVALGGARHAGTGTPDGTHGGAGSAPGRRRPE
jgi:hypothetical protein